MDFSENVSLVRKSMERKWNRMISHEITTKDNKTLAQSKLQEIACTHWEPLEARRDLQKKHSLTQELMVRVKNIIDGTYFQRQAMERTADVCTATRPRWILLPKEPMGNQTQLEGEGCHGQISKPLSEPLDK